MHQCRTSGGGVEGECAVKRRKPELLAPAGDFKCALSAFASGADAVYLGLKSFSARASAVNFSFEELRDILSFARSLEPKRKVYVTLNTLADDHELPEVCRTLSRLADIGPDAIIVQDLGVAAIAAKHFPELELHASTQLAAHNVQGVKELYSLGFKRIVTARELTLEELREICACSPAEIEFFIHGALCYSISGLCLFSAMEYNRSGNCGRCAYCCRQSYKTSDGRKLLPFSMRDLRLDGYLKDLTDAGVVSFKIEGRMKSQLYVASAVSYYRHLLDGTSGGPSREDLETVFSRRTTSLYIKSSDANPDELLDTGSLGHLGASIGKLKHLTKDREGRTWIRFRTRRKLEVHDGLQFLRQGSRPFGMPVTAIRPAMSRRPVFSVPADSDVEVFVPEMYLREIAKSDGSPLQEGADIFCSASEAVRRMFPVPSFRPSAVHCGTSVNVKLQISRDSVAAEAPEFHVRVDEQIAGVKANHPELTFEAAVKAFSRTGATRWEIAVVSLDDPFSFFVPPAIWNALRRKLSSALDAAAQKRVAERAEAAYADFNEPVKKEKAGNCVRSLKIRLDMCGKTDVSGFDEIVVDVWRTPYDEIVSGLNRLEVPKDKIRLALGVWMRNKHLCEIKKTVAKLVDSGFTRWEAADISGLSLLKECNVSDITADWSFYATNRAACSFLSSLGVREFVVSPETSSENAVALSRMSSPAPVYLEEQTVPLFISATKPAVNGDETLISGEGVELKVRKIDTLWVTARADRMRFSPLPGSSTRMDLSWD